MDRRHDPNAGVGNTIEVGMKARCRTAVVRYGSDVVLSLIFEALPPIDREHRMRDCRLVALNLAGKASGIEISNEGGILTFRFEGGDEKDIRRISRRIKARMTRILHAPLTPRAVDLALGIAPRERLRWYKDGRLPTCGRGRIGQGNHTVQFPLFPIAEIARIQATPHVIETWRRDDDDPGARRGEGSG